MDPNNSGFILEDALNESDFTEVSSIERMDMKQIVGEIQKLKIMAMKNAKGTNVGDQSGMLQLGLQIGEKFGELKKENEGLKEGMTKMIKVFEELKEDVLKLGQENGKLKEENAKKGVEIGEMKKEIDGMKAAELIAQIGGKNAELDRKIVENNDKLKAAFIGLKNEIGGKNAQLEGQITGLKEEDEKMKEKVRELQGKIDELTKLTEQIGGIEWVKYDWHAYKLDAAKCGPRLAISEGGLVAKYSGPTDRRNTVLANLLIPSFNLNAINKSTIAFYFELQILSKHYGYFIGIGFCTQQFPLENYSLGNVNNSIGICRKGGIWIDGTEIKFGNDGYFKEGDFAGLGIIQKPNSKMEYFATWNGQLLAKAELPSKFVDLPLFPAVSLIYAGDSIRANFDKENCKFKEFGRVLQ